MNLRFVAVLSAALGRCVLSPVPPAPAAFIFPDQLQVLGTEPFWSLSIDGVQAIYSTPESAGEPVRLVRTEAGGLLNLTGTVGGEVLAAQIVPRECSDGMSDRRYSFAATITLGDRTMNGCANPRPDQDDL